MDQQPGTHNNDTDQRPWQLFRPAAWDQFCQDLQRIGGDKPDFLYGSASISKPTFIVGLPRPLACEWPQLKAIHEMSATGVDDFGLSPSQTLGAFEACKNNFQI